MWSATSKKKVADGWAARPYITLFACNSLFHWNCRSLYIDSVKRRQLSGNLHQTFCLSTFQGCSHFCRKSIISVLSAPAGIFSMHTKERLVAVKDERFLLFSFRHSQQSSTHAKCRESQPNMVGVTTARGRQQWSVSWHLILCNFFGEATCVLGETYPHQNQCFLHIRVITFCMYFFDFVSHIFLLL